MRYQRTLATNLVISLITVFMALGCGASVNVDDTADAPKADPCDGVRDPAYKVWNDKVKDDLDFSVRIYEGQILASDAETAVSWMTAFTDSWTKTVVRLCEDHHHNGTVDAAEYARMTSCLDRALDDQRTVAELLKTAGADDIDRAVGLVDEIRACVPDAEIIEPVAPEETVYKENPFAH